VDREKQNVRRLLANKTEIEEEIENLQTETQRARHKLEKAMSAAENSNKAVEAARDEARKAQRSLDKELKEISSWNDKIERSSSDRHALYRRCRLEDINLPLLSGSLRNVPIEEVSLPKCLKLVLTLRPRRSRWISTRTLYDQHGTTTLESSSTFRYSRTRTRRTTAKRSDRSLRLRSPR